MGDLDRDGAPDLVVGSVGGPAGVYRNVAPRRGHWLSVRLLEPAHGNRDAIGAEIVVRAGGRSWWQLLQPGTSYLASHDPTLHFGLSDSSRVDGIDVIWADGSKEYFPGSAANQVLVLRHGNGAAERSREPKEE
jgi:hypothetical protein